MDYRELQKKLANKAVSIYKRDGHPLSPSVLDAYFQNPRHQFVYRFRLSQDNNWHTLTEQNAQQYLPMIYSDNPIVIWGSNEDFTDRQDQRPISTISQPSFVLRMLDMLEVKPGQKIFELGTASGWNAALLAHLVGNKGIVVSAEIIPELASEAAARFQRLGIKNIKVISGDGTEGAVGFLFDRVIFTAGSYDFPSILFDQTYLGSLVLFVLKTNAGNDRLYLLQRQKNFFLSKMSLPCGFVPVTGKMARPSPQEIETPKFSDLQLKIYLSTEKIDAPKGSWVSRRKQATFVWSTANSHTQIQTQLNKSF